MKEQKLVVDWCKNQKTRAAVRVAIEEALDRLPASYSDDLYNAGCGMVYQHVHESYFGEGKSIYN